MIESISGRMTTFSELETRLPGLTTVIWAEPASAMFEPGMAAVTGVLLTRGVARAGRSIGATQLEAKPVPSTVSVQDDAPAVG